MFFLIGAGLNDYKDLSLRAIEILNRCDRIFIEEYTCILNNESTDIEELEFLRKAEPANRSVLEDNNVILDLAVNLDVALIVAGTPLYATTHNDLLITAISKNVKYQVIHNMSISNVKGSYGLFSYSFGYTVSIPYFTKNDQVPPISIAECSKDIQKFFYEYNWKPTSFYNRIKVNFYNGMHTLILLDIKRDIDKYMSVNEAIMHLLYAASIEENDVDEDLRLINMSTKLIAVCRFATDEEFCCYEKISDLIKIDFGKPLHSLILPSKLNIIEEEYLNVIACNNKN